MSDIDAPHRAFTISINIQGDCWDVALAELERFTKYVRENGEKSDLVSGGYSSGGWVHIRVDPDMTHDKYVNLNEEWCRANRKDVE